MCRLHKCDENANWIIAYDVCESCQWLTIKMPSACTVRLGFYSRARNGKEIGTTLRGSGCLSTSLNCLFVCLGLVSDQNLILYCVSIGWLADAGHSSSHTVRRLYQTLSECCRRLSLIGRPWQWPSLNPIHSPTSGHRFQANTENIATFFSRCFSFIRDSRKSHSCVGGLGATEFYSHVRRVSHCW